jgi:prolipoprotein diacylglyceryltransferase
VSEPPVFVSLGPIPPHLLFEFLAYALGFQAYRLARKRGDSFSTATRWSLIVAAACGAAVGSKLLALVNSPDTLVENLTHPVRFMAAGKTMVGGLLGGWIAVELTKRLAGIRERTGDLFAIPLCVGIAIGRIGCFLTGLPDHTYGSETGLPWGVDFGDGIPRHPTQLYEIVFVSLLALALALRPPRESGMAFRAVLLGYLAFRLLIDFLKPGQPLAGMTAIQWACAVALLYHLARRIFR